jgi:NADPH:quinone reductase-like Zn-dependent oxidoreductase
MPSLKPGDTVAVSAAAGGVGSIAVQLARRAGAKVIGIASPANHDWLSQYGVEAMAYGEGLADRLRKFGLNAFIDCHGGGYVNLAIELGVPKDRIDTIIDFAAAQQYGVKTEGSQEARNSRILAELAGLVAEGKLYVPVAATFPLADVRAAFRQLEHGHTRGEDRSRAVIAFAAGAQNSSRGGAGASPAVAAAPTGPTRYSLRVLAAI